MRFIASCSRARAPGTGIRWPPRSALITPSQARERASRMPHAEVADVPGSHGGFDRVDELNERTSAFIKAQAG